MQNPKSVRANGDLIRSLRKKLGWSQSDLAEEAHVSLRKIGDLEAGKPSLPVIVRGVAITLNSTYEDLTAGLNEPPPALADTPSPDLNHAINALQKVFFSQSPEERRRTVGLVLSALGILSLLFALFPINAYPFYIAATALAGVSIYVLRSHRRLLFVPISVASLSVAGIVAWPNCVGFFPSDTQDGVYTFGWNSRVKSERTIFLRLLPDDEAAELIAAGRVTYELSIVRYLHPGSIASTENPVISSQHETGTLTSEHRTPLRLPPGNYSLTFYAYVRHDVPDGDVPTYHPWNELLILSPYRNRHLTVLIQKDRGQLDSVWD